MTRIRACLILSVAVTRLLLFSAAAHPVEGRTKPNVVFIAIDDQNDWIGHLGGHPYQAVLEDEILKTP